VARRRLTNRRPTKAPSAFCAAGWIPRRERGITRLSQHPVATESAAAGIGFAAGDEIVSVKGKSAKDVALYDLREEFKNAVGTKFELRVKEKR
jgi:hypothetical protein